MLQALNGVDALFLGFVAFSALIGLGRGLIRELLSLVIWFLALLLAWRHYPLLMPELEPWLPGETSRAAGAFGLMALGLVMAGAILGYLLTSLLELAGLTGTNRLLGALFGALRGSLILAILAFLGALTPLSEQPWWQESRLIGRFQVLAERLLSEVPPEVQERVRTL